MYIEEKAVLVPLREQDILRFGPFVKITGFIWYTPEPASIPDLPQDYLTFPSYPCFLVETEAGERKYVPYDSVANRNWEITFDATANPEEV